MSVYQPNPSGNSDNPPTSWTSEVRRQAEVAVRVASIRREAGDRVLSYYVRSALAHGLTLDDVCRAGNLAPGEVLELAHPEAA